MQHKPARPKEQRPLLDSAISLDDFCSFYWLKEELVTFCREHHIPSTGSKEAINTKIKEFLATGTYKQGKSGEEGEIASKRPKRTNSLQEPLSVSTIITEGYRSDQAHRAFFQSIIGPHFHFTVHFMNFMKENIGKTYQDAINEWYREKELQKDRRIVLL
jgi:hypothetical protein